MSAPAPLVTTGGVADTFWEVPAMAQRTVEELFWARVDRNGPVPDYAPQLGPCWLWTGPLTYGYGNTSVNRRSQRAHRLAYELLVGPIPDGLVLDHLCRVKNCVNPAHLEPVTQAENMRRGSSPSTLNALKTHCKEGHPLTGENLYIRPSGGRKCRTCQAGFDARWQRAQGAASPVTKENTEP